MNKAANKLLEYLDLIPNNYENMNQYNMEAKNGIITLTGIINTLKKSIASIHFSNEGMTSDWHFHDEYETFIKISGSKWCIETENGEYEITEEKPFCVPSEISHRLSYTGGEINGIVILVPGSKTFPKGVVDVN